MCLRSLGGGRVSGGWLGSRPSLFLRSRPSLFLRRNSSKTTRATSRSSVKEKVGRISLTESKNCPNVGAPPGSMSKLFNPPIYLWLSLQPKWPQDVRSYSTSIPFHFVLHVYQSMLLFQNNPKKYPRKPKKNLSKLK